jgi:NRPS condensation-like uncharacterized protein
MRSKGPSNKGNLISNLTGYLIIWINFGYS